MAKTEAVIGDHGKADPIREPRRKVAPEFDAPERIVEQDNGRKSG